MDHSAEWPESGAQHRGRIYAAVHRSRTCYLTNMILHNNRSAARAVRSSVHALLIFFAATAVAQTPAKPFDFSIRNIMRGPELYGRQPSDVRWSADSKWIYFTWLEPGSDWREQPKPFRVRAAPGARPEHMPTLQADSAGPRFARGERSHSGRYSVVEF